MPMALPVTVENQAAKGQMSEIAIYRNSTIKTTVSG
jgi:hypothetical protein